jgi:hypothetical protein
MSRMKEARDKEIAHISKTVANGIPARQEDGQRQQAPLSERPTEEAG